MLHGLILCYFHEYKEVGDAKAKTEIFGGNVDITGKNLPLMIQRLLLNGMKPTLLNGIQKLYSFSFLHNGML